MRKSIGIILLLLFAFAPALTVQLSGQDRGIDAFVDFIKQNQEMLGVKSFGIVEQKDEKIVRIYCNDQFVKATFLKHLAKFDFQRYWMDNSLPGTVMFIASFKNTSGVLRDKVMETPAETASAETPETAVVKKCKKKIKVQVTQIQTANFKEFLRYKGKIVPAARMEVKPDVAGNVGTVLVKVGERVTSGQAILELDTAETLQKIAEADAELKKWKRIYFKRSHWKVRSPRAEKTAQNRIKQFETAKKDLQVTLEHAKVVAPSAGEVVAVAAVGDALETTSAAAVIVNNSKMKLVTSGKDFDRLLKDGMTVKAHIGKPAKPFKAIVAREDGAVVLVFDNAAGKLKTSMIARFRILKKLHTDVVVLDPSFVRKDADGKFTYVVNGKYAAKRALKTGPREKREIVIKEGLAAGDELIVSGLECVEDNKRIRVVVWDAEKGKFRKRKKGERPTFKKDEPKLESQAVEVKKEAKKEKKKKKKEVKPVRLTERVTSSHRETLGISLGYSFFSMTDPIMKDVYGSALHGGTLEFSFLIADNIELFLSAAYGSLKGEFTEFGEPTTLTMIPVYLGGKYRFKVSDKITPFIGSGLAVYAVKEKPEIEYFQETPYYTDYGFTVFGGTYFSLSQRLDLFLSLKYDYVKLSVNDLNEKLDFSGLRAFFGLKLKL